MYLSISICHLVFKLAIFFFLRIYYFVLSFFSRESPQKYLSQHRFFVKGVCFNRGPSTADSSSSPQENLSAMGYFFFWKEKGKQSLGAKSGE